MNNYRLLMGVFGMVVAMLFATINLGYPTRAAQMPLIYSFVVGFLSFFVVIKEVLVWHHERQVCYGDEEIYNITKNSSSWGVIKALTVFLLSVGYAYSISYLGYFLASIVFLSISLYLVKGVSLRYAVVGTALLLGVVGFVFFGFLGLLMPALPNFM